MALAIIAMLLLVVSLVLGFYDLAAATALMSAMAGGLSLIARAEMRAAIHGVFE